MELKSQAMRNGVHKDMDLCEVFAALASMIGAVLLEDFGPEIVVHLSPCFAVNASLTIRPKKVDGGYAVEAQINHGASYKTGAQARVLARILGELADMALLVEACTAGRVWQMPKEKVEEKSMVSECGDSYSEHNRGPYCGLPRGHKGSHDYGRAE